MKPIDRLVLSALLLSGCAILGDADDVRLDEVDGGANNVPRDMGGNASNKDAGANAATVDVSRPDCQAQILAADLRVEWTTPNTMYVKWDRFNPDIAVREYEMVVGRTAVDVQDDVNVRVYTADDNGEFRRTDGEYPVNWSVAWGLEPDRDYFVKIVAFDTDWCHSDSNVASGRTAADVANEHVIFSESPTDGFSVPEGVTYSNRHPYEGQFHYEWQATCGEAVCTDIVRRGGFLQSVANFDEGAFDTAFLEWAYHNEGSSFIQYPAVRFAVSGDGVDTEWFKAERRAPTGPSAGYRLFQVPLRFFWREGDRAELTAAAFSRSISEFGVVGGFDEGTFASWDEVRIRW